MQEYPGQTQFSGLWAMAWNQDQKGTKSQNLYFNGICLIMWLKSLFYMKLFFSQFSFSSYHSLILTPTRSFFPFGHSMSFVLQIPHRVPPKVVCCLAPRGVREHRGCLRVQLQLVGQRVHKVSRPDLGQPQRKQKNRFHRYAKQVRSFIMKTK